MFVFDSRIYAPIQMVKRYDAVLNEQGEKIKTTDGSESDVEDHTWTGLATMDDDGRVTKFRRADAFYQNEYQLGSGEVNLDDLTTKGVPAGELTVIDPATGEKVRVPAFMRPVRAKQRGALKPFRDSLGQDAVLVRGITVNASENFSIGGDEAFTTRLVSKIRGIEENPNAVSDDLMGESHPPMVRNAAGTTSASAVAA